MLTRIVRFLSILTLLLFGQSIAVQAATMNYIGTWNSTATYPVGNVVTYNKATYYSLKSSTTAPNKNKIPDKEPSWWQQVGTIGNTILNGSGAPTSTVGNIGDFYLDKTTVNLYGPKTTLGWPTSFVALKGPKGDTGAQGPQGPKGNTGATGPTGPQGPKGDTGATGPQGPQGSAGAKGDKGDKGDKGEPGAAGRTILSGTTGPSPPVGVNGDFWLDSELSILYGPKSDAGWGSGVSIVGADGPQGPKGDTGARGATGPQGIQGDKGDTGVAGTSCSVSQVESSAVISCEDGTSAAIASAGTVVTYPEGLLGEVPPHTIPTGTVVLVDGTNTVIAEVYGIKNYSKPSYLISLPPSGSGALIKNGLNSTVLFGPEYYATAYYIEDDCSGTPFSLGYNGLFWNDLTNEYFVPSGPEIVKNVLFRSKIVGAGYEFWNNDTKKPIGPCEQVETLLGAFYVFVPFSPTDEVINAVYPVSLSQQP